MTYARSYLNHRLPPVARVIVCGITEGKGSRSKHFGVLLLGAYRNGKLHYFDHSGLGFSEKGMRDAPKRLRPLFTDKPTVGDPPKILEKIQWDRRKARQNDRANRNL
jgi:ATP-dependent DNA ligase